MARKKKRSAKQLANDRRLGRMAKARAKKKRGGRSRVTRKKVARKNPHRKIRASGAKRRIRAPAKRATRRKVSAKSHLWVVFKCFGKTVHYFYVSAAPINWTTDKGKSVLFKTQKLAQTVANVAAKKPGMKRYHIGITNAETTSAQIAAYCKGGKV